MAQKCILYVVTEDFYFLSHRLPMARAAREAGYEVHVACQITSDGERVPALMREGFIVHSVPFARGSLSPFAAAKTILALARLYFKLKPDVIHHVAITPCILGGIAALASQNSRIIQAITGLGSIFLGTTIKAKFVQKIVRSILVFVGQSQRTWHIVQNEDDAAFLQGLGLDSAHIKIIPGSGINSVAFHPAPEPATPPIVITFVGRMLYDKGVPTLMEAFELLRSNGVDAKLILAGTIDHANIASLTQDMLQDYAARPGVEWRGHVKDVASLWQESHIAVLPSRREGFPKSLLEAAACGKPMVATDVPGCRALVKNGENGLLVPADDAPALAHALEILCKDAALRATYGQAARASVENGLDDASIGAATVQLYEEAMSNSV